MLKKMHRKESFQHLQYQIKDKVPWLKFIFFVEIGMLYKGKKKKLLFKMQAFEYSCLTNRIDELIKLAHNKKHFWMEKKKISILLVNVKKLYMVKRKKNAVKNIMNLATEPG